jgi:gas vesicle protein
MQNHNGEAGVKMERNGGTPKFTWFGWLIAGVGIGAVAGILLAPQSGEDTREWISTTCDDVMDTAKAKAKRTRRQVGDCIDQAQERVTDAVKTGREALNKGMAEAGF